ncbi:chromosomal replication initiation protein DnaA [Fructilactobacillus lindneri]|uniref:Chromosomal replication initiator protein DnaA n=2 Tax=Fructilactobacillus lindneri TaxID=53444 RepID=A0A0R2JTD0_9LACO|nr:chromosomal replication initiator protein DnaA [Fructilactobacillus lindneri]ANZ57548.1 chromosomal replication initiation protein DnaA [Fructilactobacillus lindneri]ANZ58816.1 chromosomal replication initiation protein DnaA [Fructilactobacillus lindneri]KRN78268.1 chromosome replication initiator DnaA [Fructilactobacillus lindneri DSM 20690 = JCM 11027]POG97691.1 chromosomal replication initiation protein DnaA [Fructilactobacillus lindneri]POH00078.1 chromosomal replication initiation prot
MNQNELWNKIKLKFKENANFDNNTYDTWINSVKPISYEGNVLTLELPTALHRDYWDRQLKSTFIEYAYAITQTDITPNLVLKGEVDDNNQNLKRFNEANGKSEIPHIDPHLNPNYTFDTFVIGQGNQMAHAAALAVSEDPGKVYNPLFFYGGVGLGKTHLMQAIGNKVLSSNPNAIVKYVTTEKFTNDFIDSLQNNKMQEFRKVYRNVDLLLIDDIQFLANKEGTQDEFFNTFNALYEDNKQIVMTADRLPNEINSLTDRLVSRFKWGLSVDITAPDMETRAAILRAKAKSESLAIDDNIMSYIASQIDSNVRELEGALSRIKAFADLKQEPITMDLVSEALRPLKLNKEKSAITPESIIKTTASYFRVTVKEIKGKKRVKAIVMPRQIAMYLSRELTDNSLPKIGEAFGGKDHTTVIHACDKISKQLATDSDLQNQIKDIKTEIKH